MREGPWFVLQNKCNTCLQQMPEERAGQSQARQPQLMFLGTCPHGSHFQAKERNNVRWKLIAQTSYGEIILYQLDYLLS